MNPLNSEPISATTIATLIVFLAARFGVSMSTEESLAVASVVLAVGTFIARQKSTPVEKAEAKIDQAYQAIPGVDAKPKL